MDLVKNIQKKLQNKKTKITAITTAVTMLGVASFALKENVPVQKEVMIETVVDELQQETTTVETTSYEKSKKKEDKIVVNIGNYDGYSVVDALESTGYGSSLKIRKKLAKKYGIKNYDQSAKKNIELLNALKKEAEQIKNRKKKVEGTGKIVDHLPNYELAGKKYKDNEDGTHTVIKQYKSKELQKTKTEKLVKRHKFNDEIVAVDDKIEIHSCICGATKKVEHVYGEWTENKDGKTESRICKTCGYEMTRLRAVALEDLVENVDYIKTESYTDNGDGTHSLATKYKWIKSEGSLIMVKKSFHEHGVWESLNDEEEIRKCICGHQEKRSHDYDTAIDNKDGTESLICKNCNHVMTRKKEESTIKPTTPSIPVFIPTPITPWTPTTNPTKPIDTTKPIQPTTPTQATIPSTPTKIEHEHTLVKKSETIQMNNGTHTITTIYECPEDKEQKVEIKTEDCSYETTISKSETENKHLEINKCTVCEDIKEVEKDCTPADKVLTETVDGVIYEYQNCSECGDKCNYKEHIEHTTVPEDLEYTFDHSNNDGTHELVGTYNCDICGEEVKLTMTEECDYSKKPVEYEMIPDSNFAVENKHYVVSTCDVCGNTKKEKEQCIAIGQKEYMRYYSTIYEYYHCEKCNNRCDQVPHEKHIYGEWEYYDDKTHRRDCECGGDIINSNPDLSLEEQKNLKYMQEETHHMKDVNGNMTCTDCGYTIPNVDGHKHAQDEESILSFSADFGGAFASHVIPGKESQIVNPNPSPEDYCSRYDLHCPDCGAYYSVHYAHRFTNGVCTRIRYCGGISQNAEIDATSLENRNIEDFATTIPTADITVTIDNVINIDMNPKEEVNTTSPSTLKVKTLIKSR